MNNEELKKKIVEIVWKAWEEPVPCTAERKFERIADALILEGIGYVWGITEKAEKAIASLIKQNKELQHRAEVAENELKLYKLAVKIWQERYSDIRCFNFNIALRQAEKELAEEGEDD